MIRATFLLHVRHWIALFSKPNHRFPCELPVFSSGSLEIMDVQVCILQSWRICHVSLKRWEARVAWCPPRLLLERGTCHSWFHPLLSPSSPLSGVLSRVSLVLFSRYSCSVKPRFTSSLLLLAFLQCGVSRSGDVSKNVFFLFFFFLALVPIKDSLGWAESWIGKLLFHSPRNSWLVFTF